MFEMCKKGLGISKLRKTNKKTPKKLVVYIERSLTKKKKKKVLLSFKIRHYHE